MAKGNGSTRMSASGQGAPQNGVLRSFQSWGDKAIAVEIEDGFPIERANAILEQVERLSDIYEISVNKVVLVNKGRVREGEAASANHDDKVLTFSLSDAKGRTTYGNVVAHEFAHLFPNQFEKPTPPLMPREKAPKLWAKYDKNLPLYNENKSLNDEMVGLYKDFKKYAKRVGITDLYAVRGGVGEFAAEAFAYRLKYGAGRMEHFDKAYNILLKLKK